MGKERKEERKEGRKEGRKVELKRKEEMNGGRKK